MTSQYRSGQPIIGYNYDQGPGTVRRLWGSLLALQNSWARLRLGHRRKTEPVPQSRKSRSLPFWFIILWIFTLRWGERGVFKHSVEHCAWDHWESWASQPSRCDVEIGVRLGILADSKRTAF